MSIDFIKAKELKKMYYVRGKFYNLAYNNGTKLSCRNILEIIDKKYLNCTLNVDAIFIMMNPGCSRPVHKNYKITEITEDNISNINNLKFVETKPDITQYQLMRIMKIKGWRYIKIINLSDYREASSYNFYKKIKSGDLGVEDNLSSIFSEKRSEEFNNIFNNKAKIIVGWGVSDKLNSLIDEALKKDILKDRIGFSKDGNRKQYYHPCPRKITDRKLWIEKIIESIK